MPHLWEVEHPYYCAFYESQSYSSWKDFLEEWDDADEGANLLFRWDWHKKDDDPYSLDLHYAQQRRGKLYSVEVKVAESDEPQVRAWLEAKWLYFQTLWHPLTGAAPEG